MDFLAVQSGDDAVAITERPLEQLRLSPKLKRLQINSRHAKLLAAIPDDALEEFSISGSEGLIDDIQVFMNRQKKIKKLSIDPSCHVNFGHLVLEEFTSISERYRTYENFMNVFQHSINGLEKQHELRSLSVTDVFDAAFAQICQLRELKNLGVMTTLIEDHLLIEGLSNLKNLVSLDITNYWFANEELQQHFWPGSLSLGRANLPKLQNLRLEITGLDPQLFVDMGRNMPNLQRLEIEHGQSKWLPRIIEHVKKLKTLEFTSIHEYSGGEMEAAPSCPNECIEKLTIILGFSLDEATYDAINACPNLKLLNIVAVDMALEQRLFECVQNHAKLENLNIGDT